MKRITLATLILAAVAPLAAFADDSTSAKEMKDHPGTMGGSTAMPTAKPDSGSLSAQQMQQQPGVASDKTGTTATPNAKPDDTSLAGKEMKDAPGAQK